MMGADSKHFGWLLDLGKIKYEQVYSWQKGLVRMRREGMARDTIILVEHPPVITVGKDGHKENYCNLESPPIMIERGGDVTYHGPGQQVIYFIFNLARRGRDIHDFMSKIQDGMLGALKKIGIDAKKGEEFTGIWIDDRKIASIGIAVKNWITFHGAAVNLNTNLENFTQINPCGLDARTMISAEKLIGKKVDMNEFRKFLIEQYTEIFETDFYKVQLEELAEDIESQAGGYTI